MLIKLLLMLFLSATVPHATEAADPKKIYDLNEKAVKLLTVDKPREAITLFMKALKEDPSNKVLRRNVSNAYNQLGLKLMRKGENINAIDYYKKALRYNPQNPYALLDLGQAYYKMNNMSLALQRLKQAARIKADIKGLSELIVKIEGEMRSEATFRKVETSHFIIMAENRIRVDNLSNLKISCEQAYSRVGAFLNYFKKQKTIVTVFHPKSYQTHEKKGPRWAFATFDGKIKVPLSGALYSKTFIDKIIYHEFTHALLREFIGAKCPLWLNEGLASYTENFVEPKRRSFFKPYLRRGEITPFQEMPSAYSGIRNVAQANKLYREFYFIAEYLIAHLGNTGLRTLLLDLKNGMSFAQTLKKHLLVDVATFSKEWESYVESKLGI